MKRVFAAVFSALLGVSLAIMLHCTFMIVKNESSMMLPDIEPGADVVIYLREKRENLKKGDIVAYTPPYFTTEDTSPVGVRRIKEVKADTLILSYEMCTADDSDIEVPKEDILGKALLF